MEPNTGWILCGAWVWRKKKAAALCEVGQVCEGVNGWLCQQKWWDLIIPIAYELSESPKKHVKGLQSQQLSHDPLSGSEYQTFVGYDLISCVLLVWISPIDQNHKNILVKQRSSSWRTSQCGRKNTLKCEAENLLVDKIQQQDQLQWCREKAFVLDVCTYYTHNFWRSQAFLWWKLRFCSTVLKFCKVFIRCPLWSRTSLSIQWPAEIKSHFTNRQKTAVSFTLQSVNTVGNLCARQITGEVNGTKKRRATVALVRCLVNNRHLDVFITAKFKCL